VKNLNLYASRVLKGDRNMKSIRVLALVATIVAVCASSALAFPMVDAEFDVAAGYVDILVQGIDSSSYHPGDVGQTNHITAAGGFTGTYQVNGGNFGSLQSYVNLNAAYDQYSEFWMNDTQDFNVLSANHINNVTGSFAAWASGTDAAINMKSIGSMYSWSEATNPHGKPCLQGDVIGKSAQATQDGYLKAEVFLMVSCNGGGTATMHNSNIWGWSIGETGTATTHYGSPTATRTVTAKTETVGSYFQSVKGANGYSFNGFTSTGGGFMQQIGEFTGELTGTYNMNGY
jgi:hypothetical protein